MQPEISSKRRIVITADDFGLSRGVNEGIVVAFRKGMVRNTALLVNFPDFKDSAALLEDAAALDVGIHLNLTCGPPVSRATQVASLLGNEGRFLNLCPFLARVMLGHIDWRQVRLEWEAQIELGLNTGFRFTSISSHQHVHMLPQLARIAADLAREYGIPAIRLSRYRGSTGMSYSGRIKALSLRAPASKVRKVLREQQVFHNDYAIGIPVFSEGKGLASLCSGLRKLPEGVYEMVCHPGYVDHTLLARDGYTEERLVELKILTSSWLREGFKKEGVELTTYRDLANTDKCLARGDVRLESNHLK